jgi:hypothetical protein
MRKGGCSFSMTNRVAAFRDYAAECVIRVRPPALFAMNRTWSIALPVGGAKQLSSSRSGEFCASVGILASRQTTRLTR